MSGESFYWQSKSGMDVLTVTSKEDVVWVETCAYGYHGDATFICSLTVDEARQLRDFLSGVLK